MASGNCFKLSTDRAQIARDNDRIRSKVMLGAAVGDRSTGDLPRSKVKLATTAEAHAASAALRG